MTPEVPPREVEAWAGRILACDSPQEWEHMRRELPEEGERGLTVLAALTDHVHPEIRAWAGRVARELWGGRSAPLLLKLTRDRDPDNRTEAWDQLAALDPAYLRAALPDLGRILERGKDPWGEDRWAMWRLAKLAHPEAVPVLRRYAERHERQQYH